MRISDWSSDVCSSDLEYGTRVGLYRLLDAFERIGARISVACNSAIAERYPELVADIVAKGHEIIAHSTDMNGTIASTLPVEEEHALIATSLDTLERVTGARPRGWLSIARSQSLHRKRTRLNSRPYCAY